MIKVMAAGLGGKDEVLQAVYACNKFDVAVVETNIDEMRQTFRLQLEAPDAMTAHKAIRASKFVWAVYE